MASQELYWEHKIRKGWKNRSMTLHTMLGIWICLSTKEDAEKGKEKKKTYCKPLESNTGEMKKGSELEPYYYSNLQNHESSLTI